MKNDSSEEKTAAQSPKILPYHDVGLEKQLEILEAYSAFLLTNGRAASYKEIAALVGLAPTNVSGCLKFWKQVGALIEEKGHCRPSETVQQFSQKATAASGDGEWNVLAPQFRSQWFAKHVSAVLTLKEKLSEQDLADSIKAAAELPQNDSDATKSAKMVIRLLELTQILTKDEQNKYSLNPARKPEASRTISIPSQKQMMQLNLGEEIYAIAVDELREFVKEKGKTLDQGHHRLD